MQRFLRANNLSSARADPDRCLGCSHFFVCQTQVRTSEQIILIGFTFECSAGGHRLAAGILRCHIDLVSGTCCQTGPFPTGVCHVAGIQRSAGRLRRKRKYTCYLYVIFQRRVCTCCGLYCRGCSSTPTQVSSCRTNLIQGNCQCTFQFSTMRSKVLMTIRCRIFCVTTIIRLYHETILIINRQILKHSIICVRCGRNNRRVRRCKNSCCGSIT